MTTEKPFAVLLPENSSVGIEGVPTFELDMSLDAAQRIVDAINEAVDLRERTMKYALLDVRKKLLACRTYADEIGGEAREAISRIKQMEDAEK